MNNQLKRLMNIITVRPDGKASLIGHKYTSFEDCYWLAIAKLSKDKEVAEFSKDDFISALENASHNAPTAGDDEDKKKFIFNTARFEEWLGEHKGKWELSIDGKTIRMYEGEIPMEKDVDELSTAIATYYLDRDVVVSKDSISTIVKNYMNTSAARGLGELATTIKFDESKVLKTEGFLAAVYKFFAVKQDFDLFCAGMMHWAWQVKRKMLGRPVKHHLWVSLQGGAGLGKSTLVRRLTEPFGGFAVETSLGKVLDSTKEIKLLTSSYILNMDEIAVNSERMTDGEHALSKDQMNVLKSVLTGDFINARVYGTQEQARRRITFSVISTSNDHLYDVIYDEATMRRYIEFNCMSTLKSNAEFKSFERMTKDAIGFWQGINEDNDDGYMVLDTEVFKKMQREQAGYFPTNKTTWQWAINRANETEEDVGNKNFLTTGDLDVGASHSMSKLYENYQSFCNDWDCKASSRSRFEQFIIHFVPEYGSHRCDLNAKSAAFDKWFSQLKGLTESEAKKKVVGFPCDDDYLPFN